MANGMNPFIGFGFAALGLGYLWEAYHGAKTSDVKDAALMPNELSGANRRSAQFGAAMTRNGSPAYQNGHGIDVGAARLGSTQWDMKDPKSKGVRSVEFHTVGDIDDRVSRIIGQIRKDSLDPKVITQARSIVSARCKAYPGGRVDWCVQPKNHKGEIEAIFRAITDPNSIYAVRYTRDHAGVDLFASNNLMDRLPAGDCFVEGTLVLRDDHVLVPVETLKVGDKIWGLDKWTEVKNTWDKGILPTWKIMLNNGSSMRLTPDHKVWIADIDKSVRFATKGSQRWKNIRRIYVRDLEPGMVVLQPDSIPFGSDQMVPDQAYVEGLYIADGWSEGNRFAISGRDGHPKEANKRRVQDMCATWGIRTRWHERYLSVLDAEWAARLSTMGTHATNKQVLSIKYNEEATRALVEGILADSGKNTNGNGRTFTTTSKKLHLQLRIMLKMMGITCGESFIQDHGGLGQHPIYRLTLRSKSEKVSPKPLMVDEIIKDGLALKCCDFETEDHFVWLPEADWTTSQCDDMCIRGGALLRAIGFDVKCRVVAPAGAPNQWSHIYLMVGNPPGENTKWFAFDAAEAQHGPFWEVPKQYISTVKDFPV